MTNDKIKVVVADDSPFICRLLTHYLESDPAIKVIHAAFNGQQALELVKALKPNVVTLDLNMPVLSGLDTLKRIMIECPTPVVLISGVTKEAARTTEQGLEMGAVDFILKYTPSAKIPPETLQKEIIARVKAAARVKVIRRIPSMEARFSDRQKTEHREPNREAQRHQTEQPQRASDSLYSQHSVVIIGASTGGPLALKDLLGALRAGFSFAIVIVQHMPENFTATLASQFERLFRFPIREAKSGDRLTPGTVLIAPGDRHLLVGPSGIVQISAAPPINGQRPCIDVTMQSAAQVFGKHTVGVILSGMGNDGSEGLLAIWNNCGATYAQSIETCVVDSMPASAIRKDIIHRVGTPAEIGKWLMEMK